MDLRQRINLLSDLGQYLSSNSPALVEAKQRAMSTNPWFTEAFVDTAIQNISTQFLQTDLLEAWVAEYAIPHTNDAPKKVGIVMAGNIPLVGFHDLLCVFISGHQAVIKASSKDDVLIKHLVAFMVEKNSLVSEQIVFADNLKNCDAYIATGSNNSSRYFEYYFQKYPNIIRRNRTSVALLTGQESEEALNHLATDIQMYFGLGCRNVTKLYVPKAYDFIPLLNALKAYDYYMDNHRYKNNYDYQLAMLLMGKQYYMTNGSILLVEKEELFTPVAQLHYSFYDDLAAVKESLATNNSVQCIVGENGVAFGSAQQPQLRDYADGVDTLVFLLSLK